MNHGSAFTRQQTAFPWLLFSLPLSILLALTLSIWRPAAQAAPDAIGQWLDHHPPDRQRRGLHHPVRRPRRG
ncbi:MAG: hypothetical protein IPM76_24365 [Chloroflexi bacterium]|nr:hypothetical protein [Chloroflexota bacterium]